MSMPRAKNYKHQTTHINPQMHSYVTKVKQIDKYKHKGLFICGPEGVIRLVLGGQLFLVMIWVWTLDSCHTFLKACHSHEAQNVTQEPLALNVRLRNKCFE